MTLQKSSFCFLILFVTFCYGNSEDFWITSELGQDNLENFRQDLKNNEPSANINKICDQILPKIREILISKGLEPTILPNFNKLVIPLPIGTNAKITLRNGFLHYMTDVKRSGNVTMQYDNKNLLFDLPLKWQLLSLNYDYYLTYLFFKKQGELYGRIDDANFNVKLQMNLKNYNIILQEIKIHNIHSFDLKVHGDISNSIMNMLVKALSRFFENHIINLIENRTQQLVAPLLNALNQKIKKPRNKVTT